LLRGLNLSAVELNTLLLWDYWHLCVRQGEKMLMFCLLIKAYTFDFEIVVPNGRGQAGQVGIATTTRAPSAS
jgi:hypothetical protein